VSLETRPKAAPARERRWLSVAGQVLDSMLITLTYLAGGLLLFMTGSVVFEIVMRYFFNSPSHWVVEISEYMLLYIAFLTGAWVLKREGHVKIDMLVKALPPRAQAVLNTVTSGIGFLVCSLFFWVSFSLTWETFVTGEVLFRAVHVPKWAVLVVIPVGLLLLALQFVRRAWLYATGSGVRRPEEEAGPPEVPAL
jgi:TRAP-type C4-dicarboxylate transport system permease small subunit